MALSERSELGEIEANILHGIVPPIARPQLQIMNRRCRRYQRISRGAVDAVRGPRLRFQRNPSGGL
jgi:hypothetical protein